jgi:hypothetical protein
MTLNELKNDVAKLGFESYIEDEDCFIASVNRALSLIYVDRPVSKTALISIRGPRATFTREFIEHHSGESITVSLSGKAVSFRTTGHGTCILRDKTGAAEITLDADNQPVKRFFYGNASVTFLGDYYFTVNNLAVFDDVVSNRLTEIPEYTPFKEIRPEDYCTDFRAFSSHPRDNTGKIVDSVRLIDGKIIVPYNYRKDLYLTYYRSPKRLDASSMDAEIDISEECLPMLPLLTASFMWLDDDTAKAQYYMTLYRDMVANVKRYSTNKIDTEYRVNGWA